MESARLSEVIIAAADVEAAAAAWQHASGLGAAPAPEGEMLIGLQNAALRLRPTSEGEEGGLSAITIEVDDLVEAVSELQLRGAIVSGAPVGSDGRRAAIIYVTPAYGVSIRLVEKQA